MTRRATPAPLAPVVDLSREGAPLRARSRLALTAAGSVLAVGALAGCGGAANTGPMMGQSARSGTVDTARAGDVMFSQMMIPHHEQAVEMSDIALARDDTSPQVRALATQIKAAQAPEIRLMESWLTSWGAPEMPGPMDHMGHDGMMGMLSEEDLDRLQQASGAEFNRLWLQGMVEHHQGAIRMAEQVADTTKDPAVSKLADSIITSQQNEIATMEKLLEG
jgi:uncharacterized protein (DUF305 family)